MDGLVYMRYRSRFLSLSNFPNYSNVSLIRLAQSGFYFNNIENRCRCFSCGLDYNDDWIPSFDINERHRTLSPDCVHVNHAIREGNDSITSLYDEVPCVMTNENRGSSHVRNSPHVHDVHSVSPSSIQETTSSEEQVHSQSIYTYHQHPTYQDTILTPTTSFSSTCGATFLPNLDSFFFMVNYFQQQKRRFSDFKRTVQTLPVAKKVCEMGFLWKDIIAAYSVLKSKGSVSSLKLKDVLGYILEDDAEEEETESSGSFPEFLVCVLCRNPIAYLFLPCRHLCCCKLCGVEQKICPRCSKIIKGRVKVFLP